jgi:lipoate-protein ligase B
LSTLRARWLGRVPYRDALTLQTALHGRAADDYLLLLEHPHVYTLGTTADPAHVLVDPASIGAELVPTDRGGDVTYHGPGQLVGYPIVTLPEWRDGQRDVWPTCARSKTYWSTRSRRSASTPDATTGTPACGQATTRSRPSA